MRPKRYALKANHGTETPSNLMFFDAETFAPEPTGKKGQSALRLRLWCAIALRLEGDRVTRREVYQGRTADEFWTALYGRCNRKNPLWAFCHNAAVDWTWLDVWGELLSQRLTIGPIDQGIDPRTGRKRRPWRGKLVLESRPSFAVVRANGATVRLVDTGNYWPESVFKIGDRYGLPKMAMPSWEAPETDWFAYCLRDCEVIEKAVVELLRWWRKEDCGTFQMTAPSLAMTNYRHTYQVKDTRGEPVKLIFEPNHPTHKLERMGYYGGRFEAFYIGKLRVPTWKLDVNSCYLAMMETEVYPFRRVGVPQDTSVETLRRSMGAYGAVANVVINSRINTYPFRPATEPLQLHCCGRFITTLCGPELLRALDSGDVESVISANLYALAPIFRGWAKRWHDRKVQAEESGQIGDREFAKLIGNSLSGKFGQHGAGWRDRPDLGFEPFNRKWAIWDQDEQRDRIFRGVAGVVQEWTEGDEPRHCAPIISAYICAYAREYLRWIIDGLPDRSVYYLGADSIIVNEHAYERLALGGMIHPTRLGLLKEKGPFEDGEIVGTNCYRLGNEWTRSGTHAKPKSGPNATVYSETWEKMPGILHRPFDGTVRIQAVDWKELDPRRKGTVTPSGWLLPFRLSLDSEWTDLKGNKAWGEVYTGEHPAPL